MNSDQAHIIMEHERYMEMYRRRLREGNPLPKTLSMERMETPFAHEREQLVDVTLDNMLWDINAACKPNVDDPEAREQTAMALLKLAGDIMCLQELSRRFGGGCE